MNQQIKNVIKTAGAISYWCEGDEEFTVTRNALGLPVIVQSTMGRWPSQSCTFNYDAAGNFLGMTGSINTLMLSRLIAEATGAISVARGIDGNITGLVGAGGKTFSVHLGSVLLRYLDTGFYTSGGGTAGAGLNQIAQTITKAASGAGTPYNYLKWNELVFDDTGETAAIYPATATDRIIVPAGARLARVSASFACNADTGGTYRGLRVYGGAAGTTNLGNTKLFSFHATQSNNILSQSAWMPVTPGDILRIGLLQDTAADWVDPVGDGASSYFGAEFMA